MGDHIPWDQLSASSDGSVILDAIDESDIGSPTAVAVLEDSEMRQIMTSICSVITHLLRLSVAIRNPAPHDQWLASSQFETSAFEPFFINHVKEKFPRLSTKLAERLGIAISRRRSYFKYREEHRNKLAAGLGLDGGFQNDGASVIESTVATSLPEKAKEPNFDVANVCRNDEDCSDSGYTATSFATSAAGTAFLKVPPLP